MTPFAFDEARSVNASSNEVWFKADIQITTSCLCRTAEATVK